MFEIYADLFNYICSIRSEINFNECRRIIDYDDPNVCYVNTTLNERCIFIIANLESVFNYSLNLSVELRRLFTKQNKNNSTYLKTFFTFMTDFDFIDKYIKKYPRCSGFILNVSVISKEADDCKDVWESLNAVELILNYGRRYQRWDLSAFGIISKIASDQDIEKIKEINQVIDKYIEFANLVINSPVGKRKLQFQDEDDESVKAPNDFLVNYINDQNGNFCSVTFILSCLYRLAVNDKAKLYILNTSTSTKFIESIKKLIFNGNEVEKEHAIQLIAQLAFSSNFKRELLTKETALVDYIKSLAKKESYEYRKLLKTCKQFIWILDNEQNQHQRQIRTNSNEKNSSHIMISYNTHSRELCLKIKSELEKLNWKVWIDVNEIHGSSLDSMAQAVENSKCVLICVTEKYRQSINCQAEAQYAFKLNKIIIPVIMQAGYQNTKGWLGIIMGDKIFVDFTKYSFDESMSRLIKQIQLNTNPNETPSLEKKVEFVNIKEVKPVLDKKQAIKMWSNEQTKEWFFKNNLTDVYNVLSPINGRVLLQLYEIKQHTPEFFFKSLVKNDYIDLRSVAIFSDLLIELFEN